MAALSRFPCQCTSIIRAASSCDTHYGVLSIPTRPLCFPCISRGSFRSISRVPILVSAFKKLSEAENLSFSSEIKEELPDSSGVYAVYDSSDSLQFIGTSQSIAASVAAHRNTIPPHLCSTIKVEVVDGQEKVRAWKSWMEEHMQSTGKVPTGNETGNTMWAGEETSGRKADLRLTPGRHVQLKVSLEELILGLVKEHRIVAFIKGSRNAPRCGFSQRVIAILEREDVDFETVDVLDEDYNYGAREAVKMYSEWPTFPQIFFNGVLVGGCDILSTMHESGELATFFRTL